MSGFSFDSIQNSMGAGIDSLSDNIASFSKSMDPTSATDALKMQQMMGEYSVQVQMESSIIKDLVQALKSIAQAT